MTPPGATRWAGDLAGLVHISGVVPVKAQGPKEGVCAEGGFPTLGLWKGQVCRTNWIASLILVSRRLIPQSHAIEPRQTETFMRRAVPGLFLALGLLLALPAAEAQKEKPNPANEAAIAAGKEAMAGIQQQLADIRTGITAIEAAGRQAHAYKVYAAWLESQLALGKESFDAGHPPSAAVLQTKAAEAKTELDAAKAYRDGLRTDFSARLSNIAIDKRPAARPELEAILAAESSQVSVADQLAGDFDKIADSLKQGLKPYALFNARAQMNMQARDIYQKAVADIAAASEKLKTALPG